ncbi:hypothetical protein HN858_02840 [Candidatus Falkowbacteria bacterium]|jgi:hypothetical protein|nr:hypothetical protein [Candidatus Falkowbacteria bacterium]MBT7348593.1 hypothetical protein [Candidatus Falkowbacteria bacterium]
MYVDTNKIKMFAGLFLVIFMLATFALPAVALEDPAPDPFGIGAVGDNTNLGNKDLKETIGAIIKVALGFLGVIAIVIVLIGGFKYMTAGGSDEKVQEARKYIVSGIIGVAIILSAYAITSFVITNLVTATTE